MKLKKQLPQPDQPNLPFDFYEEERQAFLDALPKYDHPENDNQQILNFQWEFLHEGNERALLDFQDLLEEIAYKMVNTETHRNKHIKGMPKEERKDKAHSAALYMTEQLLSRPGFFFGQIDPKTGQRQKPTGYLWLRVYKEIYYRPKVDTIVDFVDLNDFFKEGTEDEAFFTPELYQEKNCSACVYCTSDEGTARCLVTFEVIKNREQAETCPMWEEQK